jgi:hypothetical protein
MLRRQCREPSIAAGVFHQRHTELDLGQQLAKRPACGRLKLRGTNRAIVVWISSLKPLFDERKVLVLAQRAVVVWISGGQVIAAYTNPHIE